MDVPKTQLSRCHRPPLSSVLVGKPRGRRAWESGDPPDPRAAVAGEQPLGPTVRDRVGPPSTMRIRNRRSRNP